MLYSIFLARRVNAISHVLGAHHCSAEFGLYDLRNAYWRSMPSHHSIRHPVCLLLVDIAGSTDIQFRLDCGPGLRFRIEWYLLEIMPKQNRLWSSQAFGKIFGTALYRSLYFLTFNCALRMWDEAGFAYCRGRDT